MFILSLIFALLGTAFAFDHGEPLNFQNAIELTKARLSYYAEINQNPSDFLQKFIQEVNSIDAQNLIKNVLEEKVGSDRSKSQVGFGLSEKCSEHLKVWLDGLVSQNQTWANRGIIYSSYILNDNE